MKPKTLDRRAAHWSGLLLAGSLLLLAGCRTCTVSLSDHPAVREQWTVAVLPLDDGDARRQLADHSIYGTTGAMGSGPVIARLLARGLGVDGRLRPISDTELLQAAQADHLSIRELSGVSDAYACQLGRKLQADMVVRGRVKAYDTSWFLFFPRSQVRLELTALNPAVSRVLWTAVISDWSSARPEAEMVVRAGQRIFEQIAPALIGAPPVEE